MLGASYDLRAPFYWFGCKRLADGLKLLYFLLKQDSFKYAPFSMSDGDGMPLSIELSQWCHYDIDGIWEIITDTWMREVFGLNSARTLNVLFTISK